MDNSPGKVVEMERHEVDDNRDVTCSTGLHFCGMSYLSCFGGDRTVIVKVNPADVVSIPSDYNDAKGRTCRYEVVGELNVSPEDAFTRSVHTNSTDNEVTVKEGDTPFKQGYSNGYNGLYNATDDFFGKDRLMYRDGYEMGRAHAREGIPERYRYVKAQPTVQVGAWPFPTKG
jgi:hypothetical protein